MMNSTANEKKDLRDDKVAGGKTLSIASVLWAIKRIWRTLVHILLSKLYDGNGSVIVCSLWKRLLVPPRRIKSVLCSRFTLSFLGLAFCVFIWGLQYKLSLYDPPQALSHKIPTAKLLSKNEQGSAEEGSLAVKSSVSQEELGPLLIWLTFSFAAAMDLVYRPILIRRNVDFKRPWRRKPEPSLSAFSFRPPPIA